MDVVAEPSCDSGVGIVIQVAMVEVVVVVAVAGVSDNRRHNTRGSSSIDE